MWAPGVCLVNVRQKHHFSDDPRTYPTCDDMPGNPYSPNHPRTMPVFRQSEGIHAARHMGGGGPRERHKPPETPALTGRPIHWRSSMRPIPDHRCNNVSSTTRGGEGACLQRLAATSSEVTSRSYAGSVANIQIGTLKFEVGIGYMWSAHVQRGFDPQGWGYSSRAGLAPVLEGATVNVPQVGHGCSMATQANSAIRAEALDNMIVGSSWEKHFIFRHVRCVSGCG